MAMSDPCVPTPTNKELKQMQPYRSELSHSANNRGGAKQNVGESSKSIDSTFATL